MATAASSALASPRATFRRASKRAISRRARVATTTRASTSSDYTVPTSLVGLSGARASFILFSREKNISPARFLLIAATTSAPRRRRRRRSPIAPPLPLPPPPPS
eukprot:29337-Pelagococcus_subviridis.AAC.5